jgi:transposase-like protein
MADADVNLVSLMQEPRFRDPLAAAEYLEGIRWPDGPVCPHCGNAEKHYRLKSQTRRLWKCAKCRKQFTVTIGTIFESSHVGLDKWLLAFYLLCASKKGMSAHQLHRMLGVTYKTAWFIFHRVREAMRDPAFQSRLRGEAELISSVLSQAEVAFVTDEQARPGGREEAGQPPDAIHLATAQRMDVDRFHTYDKQLLKWDGSVPFPTTEPQTTQGVLGIVP